MNEPWQRHGKSPKPDCGINFNRTSMGKWFGEWFSHCSQFLPNSGTLLTPSSPRVWQIPSSLERSLWNNVFLFHTSVSVGPQLSCLFTGISVLDCLDLKPEAFFPQVNFYYFVTINCLFYVPCISNKKENRPLPQLLYWQDIACRLDMGQLQVSRCTTV